MTPKEARRADRFAQLGVAAARRWPSRAPDGVEPERFGVLMGSAIGGLETLERVPACREGRPRRLAAVRRR
jgi:3-oxoacyl-[acyl-carrier-protein] synthase II